MKLTAGMTVLGVGATVTAITTYVGVTHSIELQLLLFINISVLLAILMRKHIDVFTWISPKGKAPVVTKKPLSNTSWFVTNRLGLKKLTPEETCNKRKTDDESENVDIGEIVPVIEHMVSTEPGGTVEYKGKKWPARSSESIAPGEKARIIGRDILTLVVEKIKQNTTVENVPNN